MTEITDKPKKVFVFLQNAYSKEHAGKQWVNEEWRKALEASRTGQRLKILIKGVSNYEIFNTTPVAAAKPDERLEPDDDYVRQVLDRRPDLVVACGKQAIETIRRHWDGPRLGLPHPASRVLTNILLKRANWLIKHKKHSLNPVILKQGKNQIIKESYTIH